MKIQDYLHLYIGCDMKTRDVFGRSAIRTLTAIVGSKAIYDCVETEDVDMAHSWDMNYTSDPDRPLLRPLSDMTEEEFKERFYDSMREDLFNDTLQMQHEEAKRWAHDACHYPEDLRWLLSKGFDLFGLIENGLALDKTKHMQRP